VKGKLRGGRRCTVVAKDAEKKARKPRTTVFESPEGVTPVEGAPAPGENPEEIARAGAEAERRG
jgi:hypothetical protein